MLYTITCPLHGRLYIVPDFAGHMKAERDGILVELTTTRLKDRQPATALPVDEISMTVRVPPDDLGQFVKQVGQELVDGSVYANLHKKLIAELQTFESGFSFAFGEEFPIEQLAWDRWVEHFTPETDAEAEALRITRVGAIAPRSHHGSIVEPRHLRRYFAQADRYVDLNVPLAFFREGMNAYEEERFTTAFHNFYFIIEDWYAEGAIRKEDVLPNFRSSDELKQILEEVMAQVTADPVHSIPFRQMFAEARLGVTIEELMVLLPRLRGRLNHYSSKGRMPGASPFNASAFKTAAHVVRLISGLTIRLNMMELDKATDTDDRPGINWGRLME
jgi:hypothetical protein